MNFKKALSILAAMALFAGVCGTALADETDIVTEDPVGTVETVGEPTDEYKQVAENDNLIMYANLGDGLFYLKDKSNGNIVESTVNADDDNLTPGKERLKLQSQIYIDYITDEGFVNNGTYSTANSKVACVNKGLVSVEEIKNGIRVTYNFETQEIVIPVEYTVTDAGLSAKVVTKDITEGDEVKLYRVYLLPSFGAALNDQNGYVLIPDGCGALAEFNNGADNNIYEGKVYGDELSIKTNAVYNVTQDIRMPVFGISKNGGGVFGIITKGDTSASLKATVANDSFAINSICSVLDYRTIDFDFVVGKVWEHIATYRYSDVQYTLDSYEVQYSILGAENNTYTDMAKIYRDYLVNEKGVGADKDDAVLNLDVYGGFEKQGNFLGIKYNKLYSLTSYLQTVDIVKEFLEDGVSDVAVRYTGWQNDGIFNYKELRSSKILSVLGGKSDFKEMNAYFEENGIDISYEADLISFRKGTTKRAAATLYNEPAIQYDFSPGNFLPYPIYTRHKPWYNITLTRLEGNSQKYLKSLNSNVTSLSLSTLMNEIYSDFRKSVGIYRTDYAEIVTGIFENYKNSGITLTGSSVNAYAFPYVSKIFKAPTSTSAYELFTKEVPFYQIVLHGVIPMTTCPQQLEVDTSMEFLKTAESGTQLLFNCIYEDSSEVRATREEYLYSSTYTFWNDKAKEQYNQLKPLLESVSTAKISGHKELATNVTETVYDNGVTVITNYSDGDYDAGGITVSAKSFKIIAGKETE